MLKSIPGYEFHWWGQSAIIHKNPKVRVLSAPILTELVDVNLWMTELENILEKRKGWSESVAMRPQIQIVQRVVQAVRLPHQVPCAWEYKKSSRI